MRGYDYLACVWHMGGTRYIPTIIITLVSVKSVPGSHSFRAEGIGEQSPVSLTSQGAGSVVLFTLVTYVYYLPRHSQPLLLGAGYRPQCPCQPGEFSEFLGSQNVSESQSELALFPVIQEQVEDTHSHTYFLQGSWVFLVTFPVPRFLSGTLQSSSPPPPPMNWAEKKRFRVIAYCLIKKQGRVSPEFHFFLTYEIKLLFSYCCILCFLIIKRRQTHY